MKNLKRLLSLSIFLPLLIINGCNNEPAKETCHITVGGQEYHYPDFTKEECAKEVQSYIDKGIIDAESEWKAVKK